MVKASAVILAAGKGTRLNSSVPKVFHKVGGLSLIGHIVHSCSQSGIDDIVVVTGEDIEDVSAFIPKSINVKTAHQLSQLGTADATICGLKKCCNTSENILILYGDTPLIKPETIECLMSKINEDKRLGIVILAMNPDGEKGYSRLIRDENNKIKKIIEEKDLKTLKLKDGEQILNLCNAGMVIKKEVISQLLSEIKPSSVTGEYYLTDLIELASKNSWDCSYLVSDVEELRGVNTRMDLVAVEKSFQDRKRLEMLDNGVTLLDPETVYFSFDTIIERDVTVHPFVTFGQAVVIRSGCEVKSFSTLEGAEINKSATIGPFARIRPQTFIGEKARVGNFVEIKNAHVGDASKVNHLSYVGDASIGRSVNIGAGTVTCNYDGFKKFHTKIGDGTFIGSNSSIVAPVDIGVQAILGAGSVITQDVPDNALAIARSRQTNLEGGAIKARNKRQKS